MFRELFNKLLSLFFCLCVKQALLERINDSKNSINCNCNYFPLNCINVYVYGMYMYFIVEYTVVRKYVLMKIGRNLQKIFGQC
jgi:hypothetical protein